MKKHLILSRIATLFAVVVACLVGVVLDLRLEQRHDHSARSNIKSDLVVVPDAERAVRERIEAVSGIKGRPLLSLQEWKPLEPVVVDGIDVSNLFSGEFVYRRSLAKDFHLSRAVFDAVFLRPGTFLELGLPTSPNSFTVLRFSSKGVEPFHRVGKGALEPTDHTAYPVEQRCSRYEVVINPLGQSVVCGGITIVEIKSANGQQGGVFVASNLTGGEVRELTIQG